MNVKIACKINKKDCVWGWHGLLLVLSSSRMRMGWKPEQTWMNYLRTATVLHKMVKRRAGNHGRIDVLWYIIYLRGITEVAYQINPYRCENKSSMGAVQDPKAVINTCSQDVRWVPTISQQPSRGNKGYVQRGTYSLDAAYNGLPPG